MNTIVRELAVSFAATAVLGLIVCGAYPLVVLAIAQGLFPEEANGSTVYYSGHAIGSELLGQPFSEPRYFHPRPSAAGRGYDATASGGSNLGPTSRDLIEQVRERVQAYRKENGLSEDVAVPVDAVTASGSGLDPHISVQNALLQAARVAKARGLELNHVNEQVGQNTTGRTFGILGEPRVNVLRLNLALDEDTR